ncbi:MAG: hypothetical protein KF798_07720 [Candidatus Paracaedibacteraceae bacterium]|nr:hypothetical protein [Candidatus Paracaedibacteraceae bacterium]
MTSVLSSDGRHTPPELAKRLLGHRRMITEIRDQIQSDAETLASKKLSDIQHRVSLVKQAAITLEDSLSKIDDSELNWDNLYSYDETINSLTACYLALSKNNGGQEQLFEVRNLIIQYTILSKKHEYRMFDAFFMKEGDLDHEKCREVWLNYNPSAIAILFEGVKTYDEFTTRLFNMPLHSFVTLIRKKSDPDKEPTLQQGWKLHVSAQSKTALKVASIVLPLLAQNNVAHKIVGSIAFLERLNSDDVQRGKFITIYPEDDVQALQIARLLDKALTDNKLTDKDFYCVRNDLQLGKTGGLSARYGAFSGQLLVVLDENGDPVMENGVQKMILDDRNAGYKPSFIRKKPFAELLGVRLIRRGAQVNIAFPDSSKNS